MTTGETDFAGFGAAAAPAAAAPAALRPRGLTRTEFLVLSFVILSFCYEIPLVYVSNFYKANPFLFDIATITLVGYWLSAGRYRGWAVSPRNNPILAPWIAIVAIFGWATLVSGTWVPLGHYVKSVWYFLEYVVGLIVLLIFFSAPMNERDKRGLLWVALAGGTWVAFYALLQFLGIVSTVRVVPKGFEILEEGTGIFSTLGATYFHSGFFGVVSTMVGVTVFATSRGFLKVLAGFLAGFCAIPAVVSGSRAAFVGLILALAFLALQPRYLRRFGTYFVGAILAFSIAYFWSQSYTKERTEVRPFEQSATFRILKVFDTMALELREHGPLQLIAGGGFMVVPIDGHFRSGWGIHNIHAFPLEQGGLGAFFATIWMWIRFGTRLGRRRPDPSATTVDENFRSAMFAWFCSMLLVGWSGSSFWVHTGNEHFTVYEMLLFGLGMSTTGMRSAAALPSPAAQAVWQPVASNPPAGGRPGRGA